MIKISAIKYTENIRVALLRVSDLNGNSSDLVTNFDLEALLRLVCKAEEFSSDEVLSAMLPQQQNQSVCEQRVVYHVLALHLGY